MTLRKLVARYMRARYWILREPFTGLSDRNFLEELIKAEEDLWEHITGERDLFDAMRAAGFRVLPRDDPSRRTGRRRKRRNGRGDAPPKKRRTGRPRASTDTPKKRPVTRNPKKRPKKSKKLRRGFLD